MRPVVCMVTDRLRPAPGAESEAGAPLEDLIRRVAAAADAGAHLIQIRERDLDGGPLLRLVTACLEAIRHTRTRIIVNERFDVALAARAHGVHLRAASMAGARLRAHAPGGFLAGRSVHTVEEAIAAEAGGGLDYLQFGPVFPTRSKPGAAGTGSDALAGIVAAVRLPVLAVGGITALTAGHAARAGAAGFAAIDLFYGGDAEIQRALSSACAAFDTPERDS